MASPLSLSQDAAVTVMRFGQEAQPLILVDGALADPDHVRAIAAQHRYAPVGPFYPGIRAPVSAAVAMPLVAPLLPAIRTSFGLGRDPCFRECFLSIVTHPPAALLPIQRLPHFDGLEQERIAVLLYLSDDHCGGTAFFRQLGTAFESVDSARLAAYRAELAAATRRHGYPQAAYIGTDSPLFDRVLRVPGMANRMIAYRGHTLHCAALGNDFAGDPDPATGRLTLNLFLD